MEEEGDEQGEKLGKEGVSKTSPSIVNCVYAFRCQIEW